MVSIATNAYANSSIDTVKNIVALAENGDIFNLTKTAEKLTLEDEIDKAEHKPVADNNHITYTYPIHAHQVIWSISDSVSFGGRDLSEVYKNIVITFKTEYCPSLDELQTAFGENFMTNERHGPPSLQIGQKGARQGVRFTEHHLLTKKHLVFIANHGCEFSLMRQAKFE